MKNTILEIENSLRIQVRISSINGQSLQVTVAFLWDMSVAVEYK